MRTSTATCNNILVDVTLVFFTSKQSDIITIIKHERFDSSHDLCETWISDIMEHY